MSLPGHRDIWLQIYCRGLDGVLILLLRFYPRSPQALLSPTFTIQRFNSLHFSQYQGRMFYFTQLTLPYWSLLQIFPSLPHISSKSSCQILIGTGLLIGEWFDTVGDTITPHPSPHPPYFSSSTKWWMQNLGSIVRQWMGRVNRDWGCWWCWC